MTDPKNPEKQLPDDDLDATHADDPKGSEVAADSRRAGGGPRVRGHGWDDAEPQDGRDQIDADDPDRDAPEGDSSLDDPGTRGAVYGKDGKGIVQRDLEHVEPEGEEERTRR
jgi:hypothetical protein